MPKGFIHLCDSITEGWLNFFLYVKTLTFHLNTCIFKQWKYVPQINFNNMYYLSLQKLCINYYSPGNMPILKFNFGRNDNG